MEQFACIMSQVAFTAFTIANCIWGRSLQKVKFIFEMTGAKCTVDMAFNGKMNTAYLLKSLQNDVVAENGTQEDMVLDICQK
jgi:hypothetical protein